MFTGVAFACITVVAEAMQKDTSKDIGVSALQHSYAVTLQQATQNIPHNYYDYIVRNSAVKLGQTLGNHATKAMPDEKVVKMIQRICWCASVGDLTLLQVEHTELHSKYEKVRLRDDQFCIRCSF